MEHKGGSGHSRLTLLLAGMALAAQDRYSLQVPGGLAFSEFRGYDEWQTVAISQNGSMSRR